MLSRQKCIELKEAGWPQDFDHADRWYDPDGDVCLSSQIVGNYTGGLASWGFVAYPSLGRLIHALGLTFKSLEQYYCAAEGTNAWRWVCTSRREDMHACHGNSKDEAVANLWIIDSLQPQARWFEDHIPFEQRYADTPAGQMPNWKKTP